MVSVVVQYNRILQEISLYDVLTSVLLWDSYWCSGFLHQSKDMLDLSELAVLNRYV